ncbi:HET domain-containing protein [Apiospora hydei]|uniref:HET domain-containing protein n=1 Tax=Apiospora hydei TaxID=1337664 RepID=A0ABR1V604_9PEZI
MRLINTKTFLLESIYTQVPYAILSHTWGPEEISFQEWEVVHDSGAIQGQCPHTQKMSRPNVTRKKGYEKVIGACQQAARDGIQYLWCDTNCIDKTSSAELSEAINSMLFTTIHRKALEDSSSIPTFSIAQRMSWAADRRTTVPEDMTYCLLGIFDINMPMLYGQGTKAFLKLQEEIIKVSDDHSILAWDHTNLPSEPTSGLAKSPAAFKTCGDISRCNDIKQSSHAITNLGISMRLELMRTTIPDVVLAGLNCCRALYQPQTQKTTSTRLGREEFQIWIPLLATGNKGDHRWLRSHTPTSKVYLDAQFQVMGNSTTCDLFILTELRTQQIAASVEPQILQARYCPESSGFLTRIGFGDIDHIQSYLDVYDVRGFTITTMRRCRSRDFSHQLVSSGLFSVLFSAVWGLNGSPVTTRHTVIQARPSDIFAKTRSENRWDILYDQHGQHAQTVEELCVKLSTLHEEVLAYFPEGSHHYSDKAWPLVQQSESPLHDFRRRSVLPVKVIFRDPTHIH